MNPPWREEETMMGRASKKNLNSSLHFRQAALKFHSPWANLSNFFNLVGRRLVWALAYQASVNEKLLAQQQSLLVPDHQNTHIQTLWWEREGAAMAIMIEYLFNSPVDYSFCCRHLCTTCMECLFQSVLPRLRTTVFELWFVDGTFLVPHSCDRV